MSRTQKQPKEDEKAYELTPREVISTLTHDFIAQHIIDVLELHARQQAANSGQVGAIVFDVAGGRFEPLWLNANG